MNNLKSILITGGAGYVGAALVPYLLSKGYLVTVLDLMIYGDVLPKHKNLTLVRGDIRDVKTLNSALIGQDVVIHLACISNDPSFELNPELGKSINLDAFEPLVLRSKSCGVKRFIYASSSSVYGVKEDMNVTEELTLEPLTDYSKFKAQCEEILSKYQSNEFTTVTIRPATVCGYSPRQRLDVVVNILTNLAYHKGEISVYGGNQLRPNIHINDMVEAYHSLLVAPERLIGGQIFNAGYENQSVKDLANMVRDVIGQHVKITTMTSNDDRSYHISSEKIKNTLGFTAKKSIRDAIIDLKIAFENGRLSNTLDNEYYFNIKRMQNISLQ
jgi:nucleoside-diphosphate-sugar epimerase